MAPARQQPPPPFGKDEKVLCFHMDMLYEAKIMDVQPAEKPNEGYRYKVHYKGWKNTWDDWVLVDRIRPFDDEHKELAAQLHAQLKNSMQKTSKVPKKIVKSGGESARGSEERGNKSAKMPMKANETLLPRSRYGRIIRPTLKRQIASSLAAKEPSEPVRKRNRVITNSPRKADVEAISKRVPDPKFEPEPQPVVGQSGPIRKRIWINLTRNGKPICPRKSVTESTPKAKPASTPVKTKKITRFRFLHRWHVIKEDAFHSKPMINISVPDHIQAMLVDDWENITKNNQLVPLPHPNPVTKIFEDYLAVERPRREEGSSSMDILEEVIAGFREYFEKALSRILLYRFERHQYMDVRKLWDNADENSQYKNVCDVYGAEHLARLIVSLPELLAQTNMDQQSVSRLREEIGKFTTWLGRNCQSYFVNEYETPSQEYIDKARSF
ncbi:uncharacterized protein Triagg1_10449 [Trichoderma aggressivum f. europaeum]|uniref:Chromatin modification-related protein EAF3 n=1 Tax=Trichoderma aggressivum f. europaeum TaxID=173218 RepID=A0AAE1I756_9HYPO|nr:hypothetical protein Triagg1_10449 [Trichoderma aggressivum f. europaeum]